MSLVARKTAAWAVSLILTALMATWVATTFTVLLIGCGQIAMDLLEHMGGFSLKASVARQLIFWWALTTPFILSITFGVMGFRWVRRIERKVYPKLGLEVPANAREKTALA